MLLRFGWMKQATAKARTNNTANNNGCRYTNNSTPKTPISRDESNAKQTRLATTTAMVKAIISGSSMGENRVSYSSNRIATTVIQNSDMPDR